MTLAFEDDASIHKKTDAREWRESYYSSFFAMDNDLNGLAWQGVRPNAGAAEAVFVLYDGDKPLIHASSLAVPVPEDIEEGRLAIGNQRFECLEPWRHWRVHYADDRAKVQIDWQQLSKVCNWEWGQLYGASRFQLAGRVTLEAEVDGKTYNASGFGDRDRAWGPRDYDVFKCVYNAMFEFPDEMAVHAFAELVGDEFRLYGYLHQDGETRPLVLYEAKDIVYDGPGGPIVNLTMRMVDDAGREFVMVDSPSIHHLSFATEGAGAGDQLGEREPGDGDETRAYFHFREFKRADGMVGKGMLDYNFHLGLSPTEFSARLPNFGTLFDYGFAPQSSGATSGE